MDIFKNFDTYSLKARVFPALIAGLPTLALLFVIVPWDHLGIPHAIAVSMGMVLLFAFADLARSRGKRIQTKMGTGATPEQWYRGNPDIPEGSKNRFRSFVANQLKQTAPTAEQEKADSFEANDFYLSANAWLRDHTYDTSQYGILFGENITYGFRRNLLGLKGIALTFNSFVLTTCTLIMYFRPNYFEGLASLEEKLAITMLAVVLHSMFMIFAVNELAVREASRSYGRQLILSCEKLMRSRQATTKQEGNSDGDD
ncbi:hypothetical protein HKW98_12395 [Stutzerimonas urumqiensis]|uniref:hypothetical protein n=1 Tax=Stutzerimonas urumqiensis TaxID=638269 RepID=UPI003BADAE31